MKKLDNYLNIIQEKYDLTIAKTKINGEYKYIWTTCFENNCKRQKDNNFKNLCKQRCKTTAAQKAIAELGKISPYCSDTSNPKKCQESIIKTIDIYKKKIIKSKELQTAIRNKM